MTCSHVRFVGGGRWATIVLTELVQTFPYLAIDWVCNSNADDKKEFIKNSSLFENTNAIDNKNIEELSKPDKVIIASHSIQHCSDLLLHGNNDVDVLIEKPISDSIVASNKIIELSNSPDFNILIGHHQDDLFENFFIRMLRVSGLNGLISLILSF